MKPLIIDNFIEQRSFQVLKYTMLGETFCWSYSDAIEHADDVDRFQFTHSFYRENIGPNSEQYGLLGGHFGFLNTVIQKMRVKEIFRIKANLLTRTSKIVPNTFHTDVGGNMGVIPYTTAIFYINTNNGYTEFEDGTKIESVENRWIAFPEDTPHRGTSCTDEKVRVVINFNYLT